MGVARSVFFYKTKKDDSIVIQKLQELAIARPREGQDKYYSCIRNEGLIWNYKRVRRVYKMLKLNIKRKPKKRLPARVKETLLQPISANESWSMDFVSDSLMNGRKFRVLNVIDDYNREALSIDPYFSIPSEQVITTLEYIIHDKGKPRQIRVDNGPEFISSKLSEWCHSAGIKLHFIQPGKPTQNAYIERFNRTYREHLLDAYLFEDLFQVRTLSEDWMNDYNSNRPHESLGNLSPIAFKALRLIGLGTKSSSS